MAKVDCPRCRNDVDERATRCQHCQVDFNEQDLAAMRGEAERRSRNRFIGGGIAAVLVIGILVQAGSRPSASADALGAASAVNQPPVDNMMEAEADELSSSSEPTTAWTYRRDRDELRNSDIVTADVRSSNSTNLGFPYGTVNLNLTVRQHPEWGLDVIFRVDEGQILCRIRDCSGTINFDGEVERLSLDESADNNPSVVFAQYPQAILRKLKQSDRVIVELPFYQNGNRQFTFDSRELEWPPLPAG